jgi:beta-lactamase class A
MTRPTSPAASTRRPWRPFLRWSLASTLTLACAAEPAIAGGWPDALRAEVERIDQATPGELGLYVKKLATGETLDYGAGQRWYLASSAKLPIAIAVLQEVEAGELALSRALVLQDGDRIEASQLVWQPSGRRYRIDELLRRMLMDSDNTAANMLVRAIGEDVLNRRASDLLGDVTLTDLAAVRRDVYAELSPEARELSNVEMVKIAAAPIGPKRVDAVLRTLRLERSELQATTMEEAYARYYRRGLNSATLVAYGGMLEKMVKGQLVSPEHTKLLFKDLKYDSYDAYRLEAGLPRSVKFIHKTGTQFERACHMGVIRPQDEGRDAIVVAACASGLDEHDAAGKLFERVGRAITKTMLQ